MTLPVLKALIDQHPKCKVTVLSKSFLEPLFSDIPNVSFHAADVKGKHKGVFGLYKLFRELQRLNITHIADLHNVLRSKILGFFFQFTSVKKARIDKGRTEKKALTREHNKVFKQLKTSIERYFEVFLALGFKVDVNAQPTLSKKRLTPNLEQLAGKKSREWIGIAPFAAHEGKKYPTDLMKEVIQELSKTYDILLFGGGSKEIEILNQWEKEFDNTQSTAGKISFKEELILIQNLDLMLSMDSGNAHLAALFEVPTVTLWGATHPYAGFAPFKQEDHCLLPDLKKYPKLPSSVYGNKVITGYENAMRTIAPESVLRKISSLLKSKKEPK